MRPHINGMFLKMYNLSKGRGEHMEGRAFFGFSARITPFSSSTVCVCVVKRALSNFTILIIIIIIIATCPFCMLSA